MQFHQVWVLLPPLAQPLASLGRVWKFFSRTQPHLKLRFVVGILFLLTEEADMRTTEACGKRACFFRILILADYLPTWKSLAYGTLRCPLWRLIPVDSVLCCALLLFRPRC